jgi:hypothetical protein
MPTPNLIHPVDVVIETRVLATTVYDEDTREPVRQAARATEITIPAQILWDFHDDPRLKNAGLEMDESGYFLVRIVDLQAAGVSLGYGDRVTKIGDLPFELYITRTRPMGHYPPGGATLLRCYYSDRDPTQGTGSPTSIP